MTQIKNAEIQKMKKKQWNQQQLAKTDQIYLSKDLKDELTTLLNELLKKTGLKSKHVFDLFLLMKWHLSKKNPQNFQDPHLKIGYELFNHLKQLYPTLLNEFNQRDLIKGKVIIKRLTIHKDVYKVYSFIENEIEECLKEFNDRRFRTFEVSDYIFTCVKNYIQEGKISDEEIKEFFSFTEKIIKINKEIVE